MTDLAALSALSLAKAIRDKKVSSLEATEAAIQEIGATILRETGKEVPANTVGRAGYVMLAYAGRLACK